MSPSSMNRHRAFTLVGVVVALCLVGVLAGVAAGTAVLPADGSLSDSEDAIAPDATVQIDDELDDAEGTVSVLVRFEAFEFESDEAVDGQSREREDAIDARRAHAAATQGPFERYATETNGVEIDREFWIVNAALVTVDTDRVALTELGAIDHVTGLEADTRVTGLAPVAESTAPVAGSSTQSVLDGQPARTAPGSDDETPAFTDNLERIDAPEAWADFHTRGEGVTIAVLDSGVDGDHPDIEVDGWKDFADDPSDEPIDYDGHGTQVSGIVAGANASGTHIGVAPDASLFHGAVMTDCEERCGGSSATILEGVEWALEEDVDIISMSLGWDGHSRASVDALENAAATGTVVVASIGNGGEGTSLSPGNAYDVISVGAVDRADRVPDFSGGEEIDTAAAWHSDAPAHWPDSYSVPDVVAPGVGVESATPGGDYRTNLGTSLATPHVTGAVALMQSATADVLEPAEIKAALKETAWKPEGEAAEKDTRYGYGIVDARAAIDAAGDHATIEGTVADAVTDAPLSNASVEIEAADGSEYRTTTDEDGAFAMPGLTGGQEYAATVSAAGYESITETKRVPADETTMVDVSLAGDFEIEIAVTDDRFEEPIETATVEANGPHGTYAGTHVSDGTYRIEDVPPHEFDVRASATGYAADNRTVSAGVADADASADEPDESIALRGDAALEIGVETTEGDPIENASVTVACGSGATFEPTATTNEDGVLAVVIPGTGESYAVEVSAAGFETATVETGGVESGHTESVSVTLAEPAAIPGFGAGAALIAIGAALVVALVAAAGLRPRR